MLEALSKPLPNTTSIHATHSDGQLAARSTKASAQVKPESGIVFVPDGNLARHWTFVAGATVLPGAIISVCSNFSGTDQLPIIAGKIRNIIAHRDVLFAHHKARNVQKAQIILKGSIDLDWYFQAIGNANKDRVPAVGQAKSILSGVFQLIADQQYSLLSSLIKNDAVFLVDSTSLVALARATGPKRERIPGWRDFVGRVEGELIERGLESAKILRGLL